jgi:hypothetical protein
VGTARGGEKKEKEWRRKSKKLFSFLIHLNKKQKNQTRRIITTEYL